MKKILSAVIATLVAMSFTAVVFAADAAKTVVAADPAGVSETAADTKKDAKTVKAEAKVAKAKVKADAKKAKAKAKADAKVAKEKVEADAKAAKDAAAPVAK